MDIYNDTAFKNQAEAMLRKIYRNNKTAFEDDSCDLEDFIQEMWCELFEEKKFCPDRAWCFETIKRNAFTYVRDIQNRLGIAEHVYSGDYEYEAI